VTKPLLKSSQQRYASPSSAMGIYVEIPIRASMDELWEKTQNPQLHQRWDLRFTQIEYLPREYAEPQRFLYRTRVGFGLKIDGQGESVGERDGDGGERTSSLKFWSEDPKSLIKTGSGYWKYVPQRDNPRTGGDARRPTIQFFTWYDYETRFGAVGRLIDKCLFRPLLGSAAAVDRKRDFAGSFARSRTCIRLRARSNGIHLVLSRPGSETALSRSS